MKHKLMLGTVFFILFSCGEKSSTSTELIEENQEMLDEDSLKHIEEFNESDYDHSEFLGHQDYDSEIMKDWPAQTYRSDGYRPSAASEWIKVIYTPDREFINTVLYWNVNNETPIEMKLIESQFEEGEISGWSGVLKSPDGFFEHGFGIIEDRFNLVFDDDGRMQTFYQELD